MRKIPIDSQKLVSWFSIIVNYMDFSKLDVIPFSEWLKVLKGTCGNGENVLSTFIVYILYILVI